jgi:hypothetical protein
LSEGKRVIYLLAGRHAPAEIEDDRAMIAEVRGSGWRLMLRSAP